MKRKYRYTSLLLALVMIPFAFCGCGGDGPVLSNPVSSDVPTPEPQPSGTEASSVGDTTTTTQTPGTGSAVSQKPTSGTNEPSSSKQDGKTTTTSGSTTVNPHPYNEKHYYIDTAGDNNNSGHSPEEAWKDFTNLTPLRLQPGDKVFLKRGCVWNQRMNIHARGAENNFVEIKAYGEGSARPMIRLNGDLYERCLFLYDPTYVKLSDIEVCNAGAGITLFYDHSYNNRSVYLDNIVAHDFRGNSESTGRPDRLAWSTGIDVTGTESSQHNQTRVLTDLRITNTEVYNTGAGIALGWFNHTCVDGQTALCNKFGDVYMSNLYLHDNTVDPVSFTSLFISSVTNCRVENTLIERGAKFAVTGTAAVHNLYTKDVTFYNVTIRDTPRADCPDNVGFDFECDTENTVIDSCTFENNAGSAIMFLANHNTVAPPGHNRHTRNAVIKNCTFIKNDWAQKHLGYQIFLDSFADNHPEVKIYNNKYTNAPGTRFVGGTADTSKVQVYDNEEMP